MTEATGRVHGDAIRFGVHAGQQNGTFEEFLELWQRCEELGYDWVSDFDHFRPIFGDPGGRQLEGPTLLAALAARTTRVRCGILVTGVTHRHPAVAANIAATIDNISGGRVEWGVGAAWAEFEHLQYGIPFPPVGVRLDMLDEACRVMRGLWDHERFSFAGAHYQLVDAQLSPRPVQARLPLVVGGAGEKRTLRIVAEHADIWNTFLCPPPTYRRKLDALAAHCHDVERDPDHLRLSVAFSAILAPTEQEAKKSATLQLERIPAPLREHMIVGTPDQCAEQLLGFADFGVRDFLLVARGPFDWATVELMAGDVASSVRNGT